MKKLFSTVVIAILLSVTSITIKPMAADNAPTGIYSISAEKFYSKNEFKAFSSTEKKSLFKQEWYIATGGYIYPLSSILLPSNLLMSKAQKQTAFEAAHNIDLNKIANGNMSDNNFEVTEIE